MFDQDQFNILEQLVSEKKGELELELKACSDALVKINEYFNNDMKMLDDSSLGRRYLAYIEARKGLNNMRKLDKMIRDNQSLVEEYTKARNEVELAADVGRKQYQEKKSNASLALEGLITLSKDLESFKHYMRVVRKSQAEAVQNLIPDLPDPRYMYMFPSSLNKARF